MNQQPFQTPPRWWAPSLSPRWVRFWRPLRRRRALLEHGLQEVEVRGGEHLDRARRAGLGVIITPNHPTHADPFAILDAADQMGQSFYFVTAWQVFAMTHWLGRRVLRQHGCFSINREGHDLRAYRQAVNILMRSSTPLVMFPEGEVFHLNDKVTHFRQGAASIALRAAKRSGRPVACVPCSLRFTYVNDPLPELQEVMNRLELRLGLPVRSNLPLQRRIARLASCVLEIKEKQHFGEARTGSFANRSHELLSAILGRMEDRYGVWKPAPAVPERVKELRRRTIAVLESNVPVTSRERLESDMNDLFLVMQLFSYPADYLTGSPSIERMAETVDKLEEDVLQVSTAQKRGLRRAAVEFGEPVLAEPAAFQRANAAELTLQLQSRVQQLLDNSAGPVWRPLEVAARVSPSPAVVPSIADLPAAA